MSDRTLLIFAILPAAILMLYVYRRDTIEREPVRLLLKLFLFGAIACAPAGLLEGIADAILPIFVREDSGAYAFWEAFFIVAVAEEGCKLLALYIGSWGSPDFNYRFDGIVYSVAVGLGFAALENVIYVFNYGEEVIISRGLLSVPGHMTFAVFMGLYYAQTKMADLYDDGYRRRRNFSMSLLFPVALHGFYDYCLMSGSDLLAGVFLLFVVMLDIESIILIRRYSHRDYPIR